MDNNIVPAAARELQAADAEQISGMTEDVLELDRDLQRNNVELDLLFDAMANLKNTLEENAMLKSSVRSSMQKIITKL